jgi:hypothetical protein
VRGLVDRREVEIILEAFEVAGAPIHSVWQQTRRPPSFLNARCRPIRDKVCNGRAASPV